MSKIPYFLENSIPIAYYKYKSVVRDVFFSISYTNVGINDEFLSDNTSDMFLYNWLLKMYNKLKKENNDIFFASNKIVFEMQTEKGNNFFLGWYDGDIMLGLKREGDEFVTPLKVKYT